MTTGEFNAWVAEHDAKAKDTPTAVVPLAVVPRELIERSREMAARVVTLLSGGGIIQRSRILEYQQLVDDLSAALAAAGAGRNHG